MQSPNTAGHFLAHVNPQIALYLALGATLAFGTASLFFRHFSQKASVLWVNTLKATVALVLLIPTLFIAGRYGFGPFASRELWIPPTAKTVWLLFTSGALGLGIGDLFLLGAFVRLGVSRTLMLYGFQPLFLAAAGWMLFDQALDLGKLFAVLTLIGCLVVFSLEALAQKNRQSAAGMGLGLVFGVTGVMMDSSGVLMTRLAYSATHGFFPLEGHAIRCIGALISYGVLAASIWLWRITRTRSDRTPVIGLWFHFQRLEPKARIGVLFGCFLGTYLSLCLYLTAIQIGHLASISAIAITGPMFAAFLECLIEKKWPSRYLIAALGLFLLGFLWL